MANRNDKAEAATKAAHEAVAEAEGALNRPINKQEHAIGRQVLAAANGVEHPAAATVKKAAPQPALAEPGSFTLSQQTLADIEAYGKKPVAEPAVHKPAAPAYSIDFSGGEILTGIAELNYAIDGDVFKQVPAFNAQVAKGELTKKQYNAFMKGGEALLDRVVPEVGGEAFSNYLEQVIIRVEKAVGHEILANLNGDATPVHAGIAAQMDKLRTQNKSPQDIATMMLNDKRTLDETVKLVRALENPIIIKEPEIDLEANAKKFVLNFDEPSVAKEKPAVAHRKHGAPESLLPAGFGEPTQKPVKTALPMTTSQDKVEEGVARVTNSKLTQVQRTEAFINELSNNPHFAARFGVNANSAGKLDLNGDRQVEPREYEAVANALWRDARFKSIEKIAETLGNDKQIAAIAKEFGSTARDGDNGTKVALRIIPQSNPDKDGHQR